MLRRNFTCLFNCWLLCGTQRLSTGENLLDLLLTLGRLLDQRRSRNVFLLRRDRFVLLFGRTRLLLFNLDSLLLLLNDLRVRLLFLLLFFLDFFFLSHFSLFFILLLIYLLLLNLRSFHRRRGLARLRCLDLGLLLLRLLLLLLLDLGSRLLFLSFILLGLILLNRLRLFIVNLLFLFLCFFHWRLLLFGFRFDHRLSVRLGLSLNFGLLLVSCKLDGSGLGDDFDGLLNLEFLDDLLGLFNFLFSFLALLLFILRVERLG